MPHFSFSFDNGSIPIRREPEAISSRFSAIRPTGSKNDTRPSRLSLADSWAFANPVIANASDDSRSNVGGMDPLGDRDARSRKVFLCLEGKGGRSDPLGKLECGLSVVGPETPVSSG